MTTSPKKENKLVRNRRMLSPIMKAAYSEAGHAVANLILISTWLDDRFTHVELSADNPDGAAMETSATDITAWVHKRIENGYVLADLTDAPDDTEQRIEARMVITCADWAARQMAGDRIQSLYLHEYDENHWLGMVAAEAIHWSDADQLSILAFFLCSPPNSLVQYRPFKKAWNYRQAIQNIIKTDTPMYMRMYQKMTSAEQDAKQLIQQHRAAVDLLALKLQENALSGHTQTTIGEVLMILYEYIPQDYIEPMN